MEFGLLGPLLVRTGDAPVPISAGKQRVLLATLLLAVNQVVAIDKLTEADAKLIALRAKVWIIRDSQHGDVGRIERARWIETMFAQRGKRHIGSIDREVRNILRAMPVAQRQR